jgi:hypothetical protein
MGAPLSTLGDGYRSFQERCQNPSKGPLQALRLISSIARSSILFRAEIRNSASANPMIGHHTPASRFLVLGRAILGFCSGDEIRSVPPPFDTDRWMTLIY